ncbi:MAG: deoxyribodipyrimidine photolyase [Azospira oryzae]|nr:MAG: deoxyribodipyrimidine photolyase [Azospira oryzae]PZP78412.1 MAG: deoxyribodipyrimidine photolyase [Azospira oryzae]
MSAPDPVSLVWFRRDLRFYDHAALYHALKAGGRVYCAFVFDTEILDKLPDRADRRVEFIWRSLQALERALRARGGGLLVVHGRAREAIPRLASALGARAVFAHRDYEPEAIDRDAHVARTLADLGIAFHAFKDHVIFDTDEILTREGRPYTVFTPYKKAWLAKLNPFYLREYPVERYAKALARPPRTPLPALEDIGFRPTNLSALKLPIGMAGAAALLEDFERRIDTYHEQRDYPALGGPSFLSVHLRFGTLSVRHAVRVAVQRGGRGAEAWLAELVWRDFFSQILFHFPHVVARAFRPEYDRVRYPNDEGRFRAWCEGRTGYPLVDAAMRCLNATGYLHNRLRMVAASFLVKDLHVDWRWGERYFAERLNDFDLASNNGNWQWVASTGCDAQPYFRIFNPVTQSQKFDPDGRFIRRYLPELENVPDRHIHAPWRMSLAEQQRAGVVVGRDYPPPIVDHEAARKVTLGLYQAARCARREV